MVSADGAPDAAEAGRYDAFLSYAREDHAFAVDWLRAELSARGQEVWVDVQDILAGAQCRLAILDEGTDEWSELVQRGPATFDVLLEREWQLGTLLELAPEHDERAEDEPTKERVQMRRAHRHTSPYEARPPSPALRPQHCPARACEEPRFDEELHHVGLRDGLTVDVVQFDEPAFNVYLDETVDWGVPALEKAAEGLKCTTAVHICYGYGIEANIKWKETLGESWRQYEKTFPALDRSRIQQVSLECRESHVPPELMKLLPNKTVLVGAIDVASDKVETPEEVAATLKLATKYVDPERIQACTNCGMAPMTLSVAYGKLRALAEGAALARKSL